MSETPHQTEKPSEPNPERSLSEITAGSLNHNNGNNDNLNANDITDDHLTGRKSPPTALQSVNGDLAPSSPAKSLPQTTTPNSNGDTSEGIPILPPISSVSNPAISSSLGSDRSAAFNGFDFFGNRSGNLPATADESETLNEESPSDEVTDMLQRSPGSDTSDVGGDLSVDHRHNDSHDRERRPRGSSQKTVLSRALQKANTAVLLDNAMNYDGAIEAYTDACNLLQQVMLRTEGGEETQKLQEIVGCHSSRMNQWLDG